MAKTARKKRAKKKPVRRAWSRSPSVPPFRGLEWSTRDGQILDVKTPLGMVIELSGVPFDVLDQTMQVIWFDGGPLQGWEGDVAPSILVLQWARYPGDSDVPAVRLDWIELARSKISVTLERFGNGCKDCEIRTTGHSLVWDSESAIDFLQMHGHASSKQLIADTMVLLKENGTMKRLGAR